MSTSPYPLAKPHKLPLAKLRSILAPHGLVNSASYGLESLEGEGFLTTDSRRVGKGDIFLAYKGVNSDGHHFLEKALNQNAGFLIVEDQEALPKNSHTPWICVRDARRAWAYLAAEMFGNPQNHLQFIGITGTNGKTSTTWIARSLLNAADTPVASIGTLGAFIGHHFVPTNHTTPDPDLLFSLFRTSLDQGIKTIVMEVSSHALVQEKLAPIRFVGLGMTSFSRDHLDYHRTMEEYWEAKWRFFKGLAAPQSRMVFSNHVVSLIKSLPTSTQDYWSYGESQPLPPGESPERSLQLAGMEIISMDFSGTELRLDLSKSEKIQGKIPYFGNHAIENFVCAVLLGSKINPRVLDPTLWWGLEQIPGRLERVFSIGKNLPAVIVDYAHTPDALEKAANALRPFTRGKLWVLFGCGGDRDKGKRPLMAKVAEQKGDRVIITSDNPRTENPGQIIKEIVAGFSRANIYEIIEDRREAISHAIQVAGSQDAILLAGKGHEDYQIIGTTKHPFDDRSVAQTFLDLRGKLP